MVERKDEPANRRLRPRLIRVFQWGTSGKMFANRQRRTPVAAALFCAGLALGGCSSQIADLPGIGTPADAPARPKEPGSYLPVNDLPPDRDDTAMDPKTRAKVEAELIAARDRQATASQPAASPTPASPTPAGAASK